MLFSSVKDIFALDELGNVAVEVKAQVKLSDERLCDPRAEWGNCWRHTGLEWSWEVQMVAKINDKLQILIESTHLDNCD